MLPPILSLPAPLRLFFAPSPPRALGCHRVGLCERYTEPQMVIGGTFVSLVVGYALGCMPYVLLDWLRWPPAAAYKLQPSRYVSRRVCWAVVPRPPLLAGGERRGVASLRPGGGVWWCALSR